MQNLLIWFNYLAGSNKIIWIVHMQFILGLISIYKRSQSFLLKLFSTFPISIGLEIRDKFV